MHCYAIHWVRYAHTFSLVIGTSMQLYFCILLSSFSKLLTACKSKLCTSLKISTVQMFVSVFFTLTIIWSWIHFHLWNQLPIFSQSIVGHRYGMHRPLAMELSVTEFQILLAEAESQGLVDVSVFITWYQRDDNFVQPKYILLVCICSVSFFYVPVFVQMCLCECSVWFFSAYVCRYIYVYKWSRRARLDCFSDWWKRIYICISIIIVNRPQYISIQTSLSK